MTVIKLGIPDRWDWTLMVRGIAGEEASARCTSVRIVHTQLLGKIIWQNMFALTQERNLSRVPTVRSVHAQRIPWIIMFASTLVKSLTLVLSVLIVLCSGQLWKAICWLIKHNEIVSVTLCQYCIRKKEVTFHSNHFVTDSFANIWITLDYSEIGCCYMLFLIVMLCWYWSCDICCGIALILMLSWKNIIEYGVDHRHCKVYYL